MLCLLGLAAPARADEVISPAAAFTLAQSKAVTIIDVRTPVEWQDTGIPPGAIPISWGRADFTERVLAVVKGQRAAPIVLICRTGNRSSKALAHLRDQGFTNVSHVAEGMAGGPAGPGWIARGLPVTDWLGQ